MSQKKQLNKGAFSSVYRATLPDGKSVVIKRPNPTLSQEQAERLPKVYSRQKKILDYIHINNPTKSHLFNKIYQIKRQQKQSVMKDLGDTDLFTLITKYPDLLTQNTSRIIDQLTDAFLTMYKTEIVHLDLKPENIMAQYDPLTNKIDISLVDFADSISEHEIENIYLKFKLAGTYDYMSPELMERVQKKDTSVGTWKEYVANDLWSLGIIFYVLLYGMLPFQMFIYKHPSFKRSINSAFKLYMAFKKHGEKMDDSLFPIPKTNRKYVKDVKALLSLDPNERLKWLGGKLRQQQQQKQQQHTLQSVSRMFNKAQQQTQKKQQQKI